MGKALESFDPLLIEIISHRNFEFVIFFLIVLEKSLSIKFLSVLKIRLIINLYLNAFEYQSPHQIRHQIPSLLFRL